MNIFDSLFIFIEFIYPQMAQNKKQRQIAIANIIRNYPIRNQQELEEQLRKNSLFATQATLSRDLREMGVRKRQLPRDSFSVYHLPEDMPGGSLYGSSMLYAGTRGYKSAAFSGNMIIIRTRPGYAHPICVDIDNLASPCILGTIAGDDTILIVMAEGYSRSKCLEVISTIIPEITLSVR